MSIPFSWLTARPIAHRGLHDAARGLIENTAGAVAAAIEAGFGIEVDVQVSGDGEAMVYHDDTLGRLTEGAERLDRLTAAALKQVPSCEYFPNQAVLTNCIGASNIVRAIEEEETTASGLVLPDTAKEKPQKGEVIAVGDGRFDEDGEKRIPLDVSQGDTVLYSKYGGTEIKVDGEDLLVLRESDVLAKVEK